MSKILLILSIVMILGSAVLGFLTKGKVTNLRGEIQSQKDMNSNLQSSLAKAKEEKDAAVATLSPAQEAAQAAENALNQMKDELAKAKSDLDAANQLVKEKEDAISKMSRVGPEAVSTDGEMLAPEAGEVDTLRQQLSDAQAQLAEAQQVNATLQSRVSSADSQVSTLRHEVQRRERQQLAAGLQGEILAVNQNWNFVVLSIGDRQGAVVGGEMLVVRGGSQIAKVRITAVEPGTSVADVVAGSMARGVVVQPGDTVIYPGYRR